MDGEEDFHERLAELAERNRELEAGEADGARPDRGRKMDIQFLREMVYSLESVSMGTHQLLYFSAMKYARKYLECEAGGLEDAVDELAEVFDAMNLGTLELVEAGENTVVELSENALTHGAPESGRTMCYFISGYISGFLENCTGDRFVVNESACTAEGADSCVFRIQAR